MVRIISNIADIYLNFPYIFLNDLSLIYTWIVLPVSGLIPSMVRIISNMAYIYMNFPIIFLNELSLVYTWLVLPVSGVIPSMVRIISNIVYIYLNFSYIPKWSFPDIYLNFPTIFRTELSLIYTWIVLYCQFLGWFPPWWE